MIRQRKVRVVLLVLFLAALLFYPFETTVVPAWPIRVTDEKGVPFAKYRVRQTWGHYSLCLGGCEQEEERLTDEDGRVEFPRRTIRMGLLGRAVRIILTSIVNFMHGGSGVHAYISTNSSLGWKDLNYVPGQPLPDRLVLPLPANE